MANFASLDDAIISSTLEFVAIAQNTIQQFTCKDGKIAGFQIRILTILGEPFQISQIYDCSSGVPVLEGTVSVVAGMDLTGGLFASGAFCDGDPFSIETRFFKVDYT